MASSVLKSALLLLNFVMAVDGVALLALGVWLSASVPTERVQQLLSTSAVDRAGVCALVGVGVAVVALSLVGVVGVSRQHLCLLTAYAVGLLVLALLSLAIGIALVVVSPTIEQSVKQRLSMNLVKHYFDDTDLLHLVDFVQSTFVCCGISASGYKDWNLNAIFECSDLNSDPRRCDVPSSCCRQEQHVPHTTSLCSFKMQQKETSIVARSIFTRGCKDAVAERFFQAGMICGCIAVVTAIIALVQLCLTTALSAQKAFYEDGVALLPRVPPPQAAAALHRPLIDTHCQFVPEMERREADEYDDEVSYDIRQVRCEAHRQKVGLKPSRKADDASPQLEEQRAVEEVSRYIRSTFCMKECYRFVPVAMSEPSARSSTKPSVCHCGEEKTDHWREDAQSHETNGRLRTGDDAVNAFNSSIVSGNTLRAARLVLTPAVTKQLLGDRRARKATGRSAPTNGRVERVEYATPPGRVPPSFEAPDHGTAEAWSEQTAFRELPSNSFGKVEFANDEARSKPAKYVRLSDTTPLKLAVELMTQAWHIAEPRRPHLTISVIGGAKNFRLDGAKREVFNRGLVKAAHATNAWMLTSGFNMGVMKAVGEAVREGQSLQMARHRMTHALRCIGVAPWGYVQNRADLVSLDGKGCWPATYHVDPIVRHGKPVSLDPNHTHFLLVDDGYRNAFRPQVADFRAKLDKLIAEKPEHGGLGIPVVVVLVEGGLDSMDFVSESLKYRIPVVVCAGTGRAADILAAAFESQLEEPHGGKEGDRHFTFTAETRQMLMQQLTASYAKTMKSSKRLMGERFEQRIDQIERCCRQRDLITVFDLNKSEEFDLAILSALLKGRSASPMDQLSLALKWNRSDVAAERLFGGAVVWQPGQLDDVMTEALASSRHHFVALVLQHGVNMKDYLTVQRLRYLYNVVAPGSFTHRLLAEAAGGRNRFVLADVREVLEELLERRVDDVYALDEAHEWADVGASDKAPSACRPVDARRLQTPTEQVVSAIGEARFAKPFRELFLWAVLMDRPELAHFFWQRGDNPVMSALVATKLFDSLALRISAQSSDMADRFRRQKQPVGLRHFPRRVAFRQFEQLAMHVIEKAFEADNEKALMILEQPHDYLAEQSHCLEVAAFATDKEFMATDCCQTSINQTWSRGLKSSAVEIILALMCPILIVFWIKFDSARMGLRRKELTVSQKIKIFYCAPVTKFYLFTLSYVALLLIYTYVVLFALKPDEIRVVEWVLHAWVATILVNIFRETVRKLVREKKLGRRVRARAGIWALLEAGALLLHVGGVASRCLPDGYFDVTRVLMCCALMLFYLRLFRVYMASSYLGPKLFVIKRMLSDVLMFIMILIIFMMAYAVAAQALLFPQREFYWGIFRDIVYYPYWQIYGELSLDETVKGQLDGCGDGVRLNARGQHCPRTSWVVALMLAVYLLVGNILLVNLLIAIFTHVFDEVQRNSMRIWKYEMYTLSNEFDELNVLPPPFTLLEHAYDLMRLLCSTCAARRTQGVHLSEKQRENLHVFEKECVHEYLQSVNEQRHAEIGSKVELVQTRVDGLAKQFEESVRILSNELQATRTANNYLKAIVDKFSSENTRTVHAVPLPEVSDRIRRRDSYPAKSNAT